MLTGELATPACVSTFLASLPLPGDELSELPENPALPHGASGTTPSPLQGRPSSKSSSLESHLIFPL